MCKLLQKAIIFIILASLMVTGCGRFSLNGTGNITVHSIDELNRKLQTVKNDVPRTIILAPGKYILREDQIPIIVPSNVTLSGYDAVLESNYEKAVFIIGEEVLYFNENSEAPVAPEVEEWQFLPEDVNVPALSVDFTISVSEPSRYEPGMSVYLMDERSGEYNEIAKVTEYSVTLAKRPVNEYLTQYQASLIPDEPTLNAKIEGFCIIVEKTADFDQKFGNPENSVVIANHCVSATLHNINIQNESSNMASISVMTSDYTLIQNINITGGAIGILLPTHASGTIVGDCRIYDGSDGMRIASSRNKISRNVIASSGKTLLYGDGISMCGYASYNLLEGNLIEGGNCYGIWFSVNDTARGNVVSNNTINSNITFGLSMENGSGYIITGNQFVRNSGGICISALVNDVVINYNYIADNLIVGIILEKSNIGIQIRDNIIKRNGIGVNHDEIGYDGSIVVLEGSIEASENIMDIPIKQSEP